MREQSAVSEMKTGDCVIVRSEAEGVGALRNKIGYIRSLKEGHAAIEFVAKLSGGTDLDGLCVSGYGYWVNLKSVRRLHPARTLINNFDGVIPENNNASDMVKM